MSQQTGTHTIQDLLDVEHQSVAEFGRSTVEQTVQNDLQNHRQLTEEMVSEIAEVTAERQRIYGGAGNTEMEEVDEFGEGTTQEDHESGEVAFPLRKFLHTVGWTGDYEVNATPADIAQATLNAEKADVTKIRGRMKRAIFLSSNYAYTDHLVDRVSLDIKRFVNADGDPIPPGPNGQTFDGASHTHYNAENGLSNGGLNDSVDDLMHHGHTDQPVMYINQGDETAVKGLSDFNEFVDARLTLRNDQNQPTQRKDVNMPLDNRAIGIFRSTEVWIKPWVPPGYKFITDIEADESPLCFRQHATEGLRGLRLASEIRDYPLNTETMEHYFGVGVWNRTNGVVHYSGGGTYQDPSLG
ncbi:hypothetical protein [Salinibacter altiplanensis]|uniref:hypothetical protein n=1 Tax=Salinibacter altiplanensis TaxID=1803181 RepID=UPI000C9FFB86|nr:hypothetical protein [Salinibacter altiplanensis]